MPDDADRAHTEAVDATRRTHLATERTELAWWRTGLTALAVAYGSARGSAVEEALARGRFHEPPAWVLRALTGGGIVLGAITALLILFD